LWRGDGWAAHGLLARALQLLPRGLHRAELRFESAIVLQTVGRGAEAATALEQALDEAVIVGSRRLEVRTRIERASLAMERGRLSADEFLALAPDAISTLEGEGDHRGLGRAWTRVAFAHSFRGAMEALGQACEKSAQHYALAGYGVDNALGFEAEALFYGPTPVEEATLKALQLLDQTVSRAGEAVVSTRLAAIHALAGRFDDARRLAAHGQCAYEELGLVHSFAVGIAPFCMEIERLAGDIDSAARIGRQNVDALLRFGDLGFAATLAAQLGDIELARGDVVEAGRLLEIVNTNVLEYDVLPLSRSRGIEARLLARQGHRAAAETLAREAVRLVAGTDAFSDRVQAVLALEEVLRLDGRLDKAREAAAEAERLLAAKGSVAGIARLREQLRAAPS
jgi:tetratricopeptide (TPR) repeat protein